MCSLVQMLQILFSRAWKYVAHLTPVNFRIVIDVIYLLLVSLDGRYGWRCVYGFAGWLGRLPHFFEGRLESIGVLVRRLRRWSDDFLFLGFGFVAARGRRLRTLFGGTATPRMILIPGPRSSSMLFRRMRTRPRARRRSRTTSSRPRTSGTRSRSTFRFSIFRQSRRFLLVVLK